MAHDTQLADKVRAYLDLFPKLNLEEKKMFGGLAFMVNGKMCVNISGENLMCRFEPALTDDVLEKPGVQPMTMKGKTYKGYCYVEPSGFKSKQDFAFWIKLCLDFNDKANVAKKSKKKV